MYAHVYEMPMINKYVYVIVYSTIIVGNIICKVQSQFMGGASEKKKKKEGGEFVLGSRQCG